MTPSAMDRALEMVGLCRSGRARESEQRLAEYSGIVHEATHAQMRHRAVLRAMPDMVFVHTADGIYVDCYARDPSLLFVPPSQFLGRAMRDVLPAELVAEFEECFREALATGGPAIHDYSLTIGGDVHHFEARIVRCDDDTLLTIVRDMSQQRKAEQKLAAAQGELMRHWRLMGLAELASTFSRDLCQPLTAIAANASAALHWLERDEFDRTHLSEALSDVSADAQRAAAMIRQTHELFSGHGSGLGALCLNAVVHEAELIARAHLQRVGVTATLDLGEHLPAVLGDRLQLQQVVLQLLVNAADALATQSSGGPRRITVRSALEGGSVRLSIADTGPGVIAADAARIFDPLYTTKDDGIGMGLTASRSIIEAHGGELHLEANEPRGAVFHITLPAAASA